MPATTTYSKQIAFVDTRVADYQTLLNGLSADTEVILINSGNGLQQMADALAGRSGVDAIHVFSHGSAGALQLGDTTLNSDTLNTYAPLLGQIGQSLTAEGDLLLYGCNVAQGDVGRAFVESIARVTQADVAASTDLTGAAALEGDWVLEATSGTIEASMLTTESYSELLTYTPNGWDFFVDQGVTANPAAPGQIYIKVGAGFSDGNAIPTANLTVTVEWIDETNSNAVLETDVHTALINSGDMGNAQNAAAILASRIDVIIAYSPGIANMAQFDGHTIRAKITLSGAPFDTNNRGISQSSGDLTADSDLAISFSSTAWAPANTAPTAGDTAVTLNEGTSTSVNLAGLTSDTETTNSASLTYSGTGVSGTSMSYTAPTNLALKGTQQATQIVYTATDSGPLSDTGTVTFNVTYADNAPTGSVTATGTSRVGQTLTATDTLSDVDDGGANVAKTYEWQQYNTTTNLWVAIGAPAVATLPLEIAANTLVRVKVTAGSPSTVFYSDVRLIAPATGPGQITTTNLPTPITVKNPAGDTTVTNNNPSPGTTPVTLDGPGGGTTVTTLGNGPVTVANPGGGGVTVINNGTGTTTVTGTGNGDTVTPQGPGPIVIETAATPGIVVNDAQPATDLTITNTGTGTVSVTPVGEGGTVKTGPTSTGPVTLDNPVGSTTVTNNGTGTVTVDHLTTGSTVTSNGTGNGSVTVTSPAGDVTLNNTTNTSTLTTTGVASPSTVTIPVTSTGPTAVSNPVGNVTVVNHSTTTSTVTGTTTGSTVTAQGTGPVLVNSVLTTPGTITVDATGNQSGVTVDNDGTGAINITNLATGGNVTSTGSGTGATTVVNPTGNIRVVNTGTNTVNVTGLDDNATLATGGSGPITVTSPDGNGTIHNTGPGAVTVTNVLDGKTFTTDSTGPTYFNNPAGNLTVNNTASGTVNVNNLGDNKTITTNGSQPVTIGTPTGNLTVVNTGTGLDTVTGLLADKSVTTTGSGNTTVSDPAGNVTLHNTGTGTVTATGVNTGATVTTTGTSATGISMPDGNVTVNNTSTGVATVTGTTNGSTVTTQGTGPIKVNSVLSSPSAITVAAAANTNITLDNNAGGTITVTGVTDGSSITNIGSSQSGFTNISNPTGSLSVASTGDNPLTVTGLDTGATLTNTGQSSGNGGITLANPDSGTTTVHNEGFSTVTITGAPSAQVVNATGSRNTNVSDPLGGLTLHNTGSGNLTATGVNNNQTVNTTGTTATTIKNPDANVTVNNTGTGVATVNGTLTGNTVTTQGTGPITVHTELTTHSGITVAAASNTHVTVDNDSTGSVNVTGVTNNSTINSTGEGTGTTTVVTPTGNLTVNNTGSNVVTVTGFDSNRTLTTPGTGPVTVDNPDGNMFLSNTGSGTVSVNSLNIGSTLTVNNGANGPVNVTSPDGNVNVINNSTQLVTVSGVPDNATVNCTGSGPQTVNLAGLTPGQSVTIDNDGTGLVNLTNVPYGVTVFFTGTGPTTVSSFSGDPTDSHGAVPAVLENLGTSLVTVANDAFGVDAGTVKAAGTGPIKFDTDVASGQSMTVNIADNTNVTFDNDGAGSVDVAGAPLDTTITSSSSGPMTVSNPTGNLTVNNSAGGTLGVSGLDTNKTLTVSGNGNTTVNNPDGNLTVVNTGSGSMTVDGMGTLGAATLTTVNSGNISVTNAGATLTVANTGSGTVAISSVIFNTVLNTTGSGATTIVGGDHSLTVNNTGTGLVSVSGVADGRTITTQGSGQIAISSALASGGITVNAANNNDVQITNTGAGQVNLIGGNSTVGLDSNDTMSLTLTGNTTTVVNLTGGLFLGDAPLTLSVASGYTPVVGDTITLIANDFNDVVNGTFAGKAEGSTVQAGNYLFTISYIGGTGNDVVLTMTGTGSSGGDGGGGTPTPTDTDGVPDATESAIPGITPAGGGTAVAGDGNGDGVSDSQQSNVTSVPFRNTDTAVTNPGSASQTFVSLVADAKDGKIDPDSNTATLSNVRQLDAPTDLPSNIKMPLGLISFSSNVGTAGTTETFSLYVDSTLGVDSYFKKNAAGVWVNIANAEHGGKVVSEGGKTRLDFKITDGGEFDSDGIANGIITDPGAPGYSIITGTDSDKDQFPDALEAANGLTVGVKDNDVFTSSKFFVMQLYRDILYREAEPGGLQYWQNQMDTGALTRSQVAVAFLDSVEFQTGTGAIARMYFGSLNRLPDAAGITFWMDQQKTGSTIAQIANSFSASSEFTALNSGLTDSAFIQKQYQTVLGRAATTQEQTDWSTQLSAGANRGVVVLGLTESAEYKLASDTKLSVALDYLGLLGRPAEQAGFDYWVNMQSTAVPVVTVIGGFIASAEYHDRFLP